MSQKTNHGSVLFVDSSTEVRDAFERQTKRYTIAFASTVREALDALETQQYDVIGMELTLESGPGVRRGGYMAGTQIIETVKGKYPTTKIVALTQLNNRDIENQVMKMGCDAFMPKPLVIGELKQMIERCCCG